MLINNSATMEFKAHVEILKLIKEAEKEGLDINFSDINPDLNPGISARKALQEAKNRYEAFKTNQENAALMQEIQSRQIKEIKAGSVSWEKGDSKSDKLGDFIRADIMTGSYTAMRESSTMPEMPDKNEKTRRMYERYFKAKYQPEGLDSDPVVKLWVENGDKKSWAIIAQMQKQPEYDKKSWELSDQMKKEPQRRPLLVTTSSGRTRIAGPSDYR